MLDQYAAIHKKQDIIGLIWQKICLLIYPVPRYLLSATTFPIITTIATASTSFISFISDLTVYSSNTICVYKTATQDNSLCFQGRYSMKAHSRCGEPLGPPDIAKQ